MSHARQGIYAKWYCRDCTVNRYHEDLWPCRRCCGYTMSPLKIVRDVLTVKGRRSRRCPS